MANKKSYIWKTKNEQIKNLKDTNKIRINNVSLFSFSCNFFGIFPYPLIETLISQ